MRARTQVDNEPVHTVSLSQDRRAQFHLGDEISIFGIGNKIFAFCSFSISTEI